MSLALNDSEEIEKFLEAVTKSEEESKHSFKIAPLLTKRQLTVVNLLCNLAILSAYSNFTWRLIEVGEDYLTILIMLVCFSVSAILFGISSYKKNPKFTNTLTSYSLLLFSLFLFGMAIHIKEKVTITIDETYFDELEEGFKLDSEGTKAAYKQNLIKDLTYGQLYVITSVASFSTIFLFFLLYDSFSKFYSFLVFGFCVSMSVYNTFEENKFRKQSNLADTLLYSSLLFIVGAVKCYLFWMTRNLTENNQHLSKIREFYQNWVTQNKMTYILLRNEEVIYTNERYFPKNLLDSLEICQSLDKNIKEGQNFSEILRKIEGSKAAFETKAIVRQRNSASEERFFECLVKSYSPGYSEVILIDNTSVVKTEKKKVEQEYSNMLFAKIAHEFKTPLSNIQLLTERLAVQIDSKEVKMMHNLSHFIFYLVKDMSDYFQRETKTKIEMVNKEISLTETCQFCFEVVNSLISLNSDKKDFLKVKFKNLVGESKILGDQVRIKQILLNLLHNSMKFTFSGEITLKLEKESEAYRITVTDTGKGMDEQMLSKVLSLDGSLQIRAQYSQNGSGVGLFIVQNLVKVMDFTFEIKSKLGCGTTASISIPSFEQEDSLSNTESFDCPLFLSPELVVEGNTEELSRNCIFVIDDNAINTSSMLGILAKIKKEYRKNWTFISLTDGIHLLSSLITHLRRGFTVKAVIIDEYMEIMNGSTAVEINRNLEKDGKIPLIKYFSYSSIEDAFHYDRMLSKGIDDVIPKPGGMEDVFAVLSRHELV